MNHLLKLPALLFLVSGCMHSVHQVALGEFEELPAEAQRRPIEVQTEQSVFLASGNTDFADEAMKRLAERCPNGRVTGIQARHSTDLGFLVHENHMKVTAYCVEESPRSASRN